MIVGCYTLDLYCKNTVTGGADKHSCERSPYDAVQPGQWVGKTYKGALRKALNDGWRIDPLDGDAICPRCASRNPT